MIFEYMHPTVMVVILLLIVLLLITTFSFKTVEKEKNLSLSRCDVLEKRSRSLQSEKDELLKLNEALETELKTLKKQLQETAEDEAKQVHGKVFQARIYEKATPDVYQAVFEYTTNGQRVMQDLVNRFCGSAYTSDQNGGERETCRKLGQAEVISYINRQIYMANNPEAFKQYGVDDE